MRGKTYDGRRLSQYYVRGLPQVAESTPHCQTREGWLFRERKKTARGDEDEWFRCYAGQDAWGKVGVIRASEEGGRLARRRIIQYRSSELWAIVAATRKESRVLPDHGMDV